MSRRIGNNIISGAPTGYDWVGTLAEYNTAWNAGVIQPSWICWITDDNEQPTTANVPDSADRRYCTEDEKTIIQTARTNSNFIAGTSYLAPDGSGSALVNLKTSSIKLNLSTRVYTYMGSTQSLSSGVATKLQLNSKAYNSLNEWDTALYRFTPTFSQIADTIITLSPTVVGPHILTVYVDGSATGAMTINFSSPCNINVPITYSQGHYYEFYVTASSAMSMNAYSAIQILTRGT